MGDQRRDDAEMQNPGIGVETYTYHGEPVTAEVVARLALLEMYEGGPLDPDRTLHDLPSRRCLETLGLRLHDARR